MSRMIVPGLSSVKPRSTAIALYAATGEIVAQSGVRPTSASIDSRLLMRSRVTAKMPTSMSGESGDTKVW